MGAERTPAEGSPPRIGLVLGAGGVLGAAWMTGVLPALQERLPCAVSDVELIVGTSAGACWPPGCAAAPASTR
jgi:predicted acylesterase/phospholipase RssA